MSLRVKALLVGVAALLAVIWALRAQQERSSLQWLAEQRLADERSAFAPTDVVEMGRMPPELRESSGLGASRTYPGVFWTHNDSGDEPRLYALDADAALLATIEVIGADARDWEAMTLGRCPTVSDRSCLYVADMGDNRSVRESVALYIVEEPDPFGGDAEVPLVGTVPFVYPDGYQHGRNAHPRRQPAVADWTRPPGGAYRHRGGTERGRRCARRAHLFGDLPFSMAHWRCPGADRGGVLSGN